MTGRRWRVAVTEDGPGDLAIMHVGEVSADELHDFIDSALDGKDILTITIFVRETSDDVAAHMKAADEVIRLRAAESKAIH